MKKIFSILSFVLMLTCCNFVFTSCGDDDDEEELKEGIDRAILGSWEDVDEHDGWRDVWEFNSDGIYYATTMDLKDEGKNYLDDNFAYYMEKGNYTASNGVLSATLIHEKNHKNKDKEWHKVEELHAVFKYQIIDKKTLVLTYISSETGKETTIKYTKCE